jgi:hypothetical protein
MGSSLLQMFQDPCAALVMIPQKAKKLFIWELFFSALQISCKAVPSLLFYFEKWEFIKEGPAHKQ